uniref:ADAMTS cysteine-rich domain-containing protein n=1 Tax=Anopheles culicifacies TaxID=139723 RepID=A0A182M3Y5_9DIPT
MAPLKKFHLMLKVSVQRHESSSQITLSFRSMSECNGLADGKRQQMNECPSTDGDFREQQCASFNSQTFQDKRYIWEAFVKEDAECELNCKPIGMRYFATLNKTVIDGTPCSKPTEYFRRNNSGRGICVEGLCKPTPVTPATQKFFTNGSNEKTAKPPVQFGKDFPLNHVGKGCLPSVTFNAVCW